MTNREFLRKLSAEELAAFFTVGIKVKYKNLKTESFYFNIDHVKKSNLQTQEGVQLWLEQECQFTPVKD